MTHIPAPASVGQNFVIWPQLAAEEAYPPVITVDVMSDTW